MRAGKTFADLAPTHIIVWAGTFAEARLWAHEAGLGHEGQKIVRDGRATNWRYMERCDDWRGIERRSSTSPWRLEKVGTYRERPDYAAEKAFFATRGFNMEETTS